MNSTLRGSVFPFTQQEEIIALSSLPIAHTSYCVMVTFSYVRCV